MTPVTEAIRRGGYERTFALAPGASSGGGLWFVLNNATDDSLSAYFGKALSSDPNEKYGEEYTIKSTTTSIKYGLYTSYGVWRVGSSGRSDPRDREAAIAELNNGEPPRYGLREAQYDSLPLTVDLRQQLLPKYAVVTADHVTLAYPTAGVRMESPKVIAYGYADDGGVECLAVTVNGQKRRPDGTLYHVTLSHAEDRLPQEAGKVAEAAKAITPFDVPVGDSIIAEALGLPAELWHGTGSGDLRGGWSGLHLGSRLAAKIALEANIGMPAVGEWDGTREYGSTLLAGQRRMREEKRNITGYNSHAPEDDYYAADHPESYPKHSSGESLSPQAKPTIFKARVTGPMAKQRVPYEDFSTNRRMAREIARGPVNRGYVYHNSSEDVGSHSVVVPHGGFIVREAVRRGGRQVSHIPYSMYVEALERCGYDKEAATDFVSAAGDPHGIIHLVCDNPSGDPGEEYGVYRMDFSAAWTRSLIRLLSSLAHAGRASTSPARVRQRLGPVGSTRRPSQARQPA